jgi:hypothetical protein
VVAVGGDRRGVHKSLWALRGDRRLEHVAGPGQIDSRTLFPRSHDDEREVHHDVGVGDQGIDSIAVENVALPVFRLTPVLSREVERPTGHPDDALHGGVLVQGGNGGYADVARGPRDRNRQPHAWVIPRRRVRETRRQALSASACVAAL